MFKVVIIVLSIITNQFILSTRDNTETAVGLITLTLFETDTSFANTGGDDVSISCLGNVLMTPHCHSSFPDRSA